MIVEAPITVREVLRLLLAADSYPRLRNHDWREADLLVAEAPQKRQPPNRVPTTRQSPRAGLRHFAAWEPE